MKYPNILIFYTDQLRWDAVGFNGNPHVHTPNLDRLAQQSINFDHCFVQNPLCMPSRASFLTGQYPSTLGITHMGVPVPLDTITLPRLLAPYGYRTANIGKLHFLPHANRDHRLPHPSYGFDHLEISDEPGVYEDAYRAWVRRKAPDQLAHLSVGLPPATHIWQQTMDVKDGIEHPGAGGRADFEGAIPFAGGDQFTHSAFVADQTLEFLRQQSAHQPFLCIASFFAPHAPWVVPQKYLDLYDAATLPLPDFPPEMERPAALTDNQLRDARRGYYAMISEVDDHIGLIMAQLAVQGLAEDTIIVFTSDHGEWLGDHGRYGKGYPGDDAVARVPLLLHCPAETKHSGVTIQHIVEALDVLPTLLACAGIQIPPHLQGNNLLPILSGTASQDAGSALMEFTDWKTLRTTNYRYLIHRDGRERLWDMQADPGEYTDVADQDEYAGILAEHRHLMLQRLLELERPRDRIWPY